ncbi:hypothetical protein OL239_09470 [Arthrobacter sp. ATA002]|uniref:hypothetical protein n=1 Tax=Arthrobacter sp. ATA002 TaxID=2991715 RepID=UPI0022A6DE46|nr:hypothetical protein [Arthrobacter sp. ATA002]WAP53237.1 hypothetical protein OL239_09470 [Arthrobacter sp. ATA002]
MGIFRRGVSAGPEQHIDNFWTWWTSGAGSRFSAAAATGHWGSLPAEMEERLAAVHPDLAWDTAPGRTSRHLLAVSSEGDPVLRRIAELWLRRAPRADGEWEFAAARQPVPGVAGQSLEIDGRSFSLGSARFGLREDSRTGRFDVVIHHPLFTAVAEGRSRQICFLLLDWLLGEDGVTRWIGAVEPAAAGAAADVAAGELLAAVTAAAASAPAGWVLLNGTTQDGGPVMVAARRPLRWIDYPTFDLHTRVRLPYSGGENGLPTQAGLEALRGTKRPSPPPSELPESLSPMRAPPVPGCSTTTRIRRTPPGSRRFRLRPGRPAARSGTIPTRDGRRCAGSPSRSGLSQPFRAPVRNAQPRPIVW